MENKFRILPESFRDFTHYIIVSKKIPKTIIKKLNMTLEKLKYNGELTRIFEKNVAHYNPLDK